MANILQRMEQSLKLFKSISESETAKNLPAGSIETLNKVFETAQNLSNELTLINRNIIDLTKFDDEKLLRSNNLEFWNNLPSGVIKTNTPQYEELKQHSTTIKDFYRAAIDISKIVKFNEIELAISKAMVRDFKRIERSWSDFKKAISQNKNQFETIVRYCGNLLDFFDILQNHQVILDLAVGIFRDNKWEKMDIKRLRYLKNPNTKVKFIYTFDSNYTNLITGVWFEGYVYQTLLDQFYRLGVDYEIYPLVSYNSTANAKLSHGEIDVLARVGDDFLFVECKSGRLVDEWRNEISEIIKNREKVREICNATRITNYKFILVYNSVANPPSQINEAFKKTDIITIEITDLRGQIIDFVRNIK